MSIKKGIYKYNTGEKDSNGNEIFDDIYFKTFANLVEEDENHRFTSDKEKGIWNGKASTDVVTQTVNGLMSIGDKKKLDGVQAGANAYVHPSSHAAIMIVEDTNNRFVTDTEKATWNGKASIDVVTQTANGLMAAVDKKKLDGVQAGANAYVHPSSHPATMIVEDTNHKFVTDTEKATWNNKVDKKGLLNLVYPMGSIYMSINNVSPSTFLGGTWVTWGIGRVPIGIDASQAEFSTAEKTGGEKNHTLAINEIPSHNHTDGTYDRLMKKSGINTITSASVDNDPGSGDEVDLYFSGRILPAGGGLAHNNLQPYITCYMWKRTA
ncbi:hypothetical protein NNC19_04850 [Clostridium sp. SHJSY1]|uniref:phage baseplate protein n=1 Tax=Clostridium sp. SHJSY1 TaxID=2942483 RepID=UPI002876817E|nr:hypothetical protein [Clostridium sp. SHJSY1]MDS0525000.1 hypothetical protein [Clostridium sp. SHJSY1]